MLKIEDQIGAWCVMKFVTPKKRPETQSKYNFKRLID